MSLIRDARPEDREAGAALMREAGDRLMDALVVARERSETEAALRELWDRPGNRFSSGYARVLEDEAGAAGMAIGYPHEIMAALNMGTAAALFRLRGLRFALSVLIHPIRSLGLLLGKESEPGDWYLCVLAADPRKRGRGFGSALLEDAEARARAAGARALSLVVAAHNQGARRLYERFGMRIRGRLDKVGCVSYRMAKPLLSTA